MEKMDVRLISLVQMHGIVVARARAMAPAAGAEVSIEVKFVVSATSGRENQKAEAYDRILSILDPA